MNLKGSKDKYLYDGKQNKYLSFISIVMVIGLLYVGVSLPNIDPDKFCERFTDVSDLKKDINGKIDVEFSSPADTLKASICTSNENSDLRDQLVGYAIYPYSFAMRSFFLFLSFISLGFFLKNKYRLVPSEVVLYAIAFFFWSIALLIYVSIYLGWF